MVFMVFDLETTGFIESNPHIVSIAFNLYHDDTFELIEEHYSVVKPPTEDYVIPQESVNVHGITTEYARENGVCIKEVLKKLHSIFDTYTITKIVAHNIKFDIGVLSLQMNRYDEPDSSGKKLKEKLFHIEGYCTMINSIEMLSLYRTTKTGRKYKKYPKLIELYQHLFKGEDFNAHNALDDVRACFRCYKEMCLKQGRAQE
jgi:DNA polymerase III epsilon subunit-like protein